MLVWNHYHRYWTVGLVFLFVLVVVFFQSRSLAGPNPLPRPPQAAPTEPESHPTGTSRLHFLVPASKPHVDLCRVLLSSALLGYPPPIIPGWHGKGELDAAVTHLAKVRAILRYLDNLPAVDDNDLVLIIDGYDIVMQLPPEIMIQRYFDIVRAANKKLDARLGSATVGPMKEKPRQSILLGPDKLCWPMDDRRPACWAVPEDVGIPKDAFGKGNPGDFQRHLPRWLNSGTIIGPVDDMREFFRGTIHRMGMAYNPDYEHRESDQMYMSDMWAEQEYMRTVAELKLRKQTTDDKSLIPPGGPEGRFIPQYTARQKVEFHLSLDYESALFQTRAFYEDYYDFLKFDQPGLAAHITDNSAASLNFVPFDIRLPTTVRDSLGRLLASINSNSTDIHALLAKTPLGTNVVTRHVFALFHCTGGKDYIAEFWRRMWFYPRAKSLLIATLKSIVKDKRVISETPIDDRTWRGATEYPSAASSIPQDDGNAWVRASGAWSDVGNEWLPWQKLCSAHEGILFEGEMPPKSGAG